MLHSVDAKTRFLDCSPPLPGEDIAGFMTEDSLFHSQPAALLAMWSGETTLVSVTTPCQGSVHYQAEPEGVPWRVIYMSGVEHESFSGRIDFKEWLDANNFHEEWRGSHMSGGDIPRGGSEVIIMKRQ